MKYFLYSIVWLCSYMLLTGCSNETLLPEQEMKSFDGLQFVVRVHNGLGESTRASSSKSYWEVGDKIILSIDNDDNNCCVLEYEGNENWKVSKVGQQTNFLNAQGNLCAIHADALNMDGNNIATKGDILYTRNGSYVKHDNVVIINLDMNQRPIARIAIVGLASNSNLEGLEEYSNLSSLSSMNWTSMDETNKEHYKEVYGDTCVYYGLLKSNESGETTVRVTADNGLSYERVYPKQLQAGDYVIIQGPLSKESVLWSKHLLVHSITLDQTELNLVIGDEFTINASLFNKDADETGLIWESSNTNVATVNESGTVKALSNGDTQIIVKSVDGSAVATCDVHVRNIEDYIAIERGSYFSSSMGGSYTLNDFDLRITNSYSKSIKLSDRLGLSSDNVDVLLYLSEFTATYSKTELNPSESSNIRVHLLFSKSFGMSFGDGTEKQTWITLEFSEEGSSKVYSSKKYLPWNYY